MSESDAGRGEYRDDSANQPRQQSFDKLLVTVLEASRLLSVNRSTVYDLMGRGELPSLRIGRRRLISTQALLDFVAEHESRKPT
jgi:excisionase family DNA binding protein